MVRRREALPRVCMLSGAEATRAVRCYFHWQERPFAQNGLSGLVRHYLLDVRKATLEIPIADDLMRLRRIGWALFATTAVLAIATIAGLAFGQMVIAQMPAGPEKRWWNDLGVPIIAAGGSLLTGLAALGSYKVMPMPTRRLKPVGIDESHVRLSGACPAYLAQLPQLGDRQFDSR